MKQNKKTKYFDLTFTFRYVCMKCNIDSELYDDDEQKKINQILQCMSKEIVIDKSYVEFKGNKHQDTFMIEKGWNNLCQLAINTHYGKCATVSQNEMMIEAYAMMILCYTYLFFENLGYSAEGLCFYLPKKGKFMIEYQKDTINEWKYYKGPWQNWHKKNKKFTKK